MKQDMKKMMVVSSNSTDAKGEASELEVVGKVSLHTWSAGDRKVVLFRARVLADVPECT